MSAPEEEDWELTTVPPRRSCSMSYRTSPHTLSRSLVHLEEKAVQNTRCFKQFPHSCISEVCVNQTGINTKPLDLDLAPLEGQRHHSWPWPDLGYAMTRLEQSESSRTAFYYGSERSRCLSSAICWQEADYFFFFWHLWSIKTAVSTFNFAIYCGVY